MIFKHCKEGSKHDDELVWADFESPVSFSDVNWSDFD